MKPLILSQNYQDFKNEIGLKKLFSMLLKKLQPGQHVSQMRSCK